LEGIPLDTKQQRGQFFTTNPKVQAVMHRLVTHTSGVLLEPSAGAGDLLFEFEKNKNFKIEAVELDSSIATKCKTKIVFQDFFVFAVGKDNRYDVIYGNPPYVAWKSLEQDTKVSAADVKKEYSDKTNLYHLFIDRCIDLLAPRGELVFIVPKEWLYTSSAAPLRNKVLREGSLTHIIDCGEEKLFADADVPALLIFRFVKGERVKHVQFSGSLDEAYNDSFSDKTLTNTNGRYILLDDELTKEVTSWGRLKDNFDVKVGIVSGSDNIYRVGDSGLSGSGTKNYLTTKGVELFIDCNDFDKESDIPKAVLAELKKHKAELLKRKISKFDDTNWWKYGAIRNKDSMASDSERFYALVKTRSATPFFENDEKFYGGGILGIFKNGKVTVKSALKILNSTVYRGVMEAMFLTTGNKVSLQPATLEDAPFPKTEADAKAFIKKHGIK
jgi:adenine-specific DNA-methyltransferase